MTPKAKSPLSLAQIKQIEAAMKEMAVLRLSDDDMAHARVKLFNQYIALNEMLKKAA